MKQSLIQIPSARLACEVYGEGSVSLVVEMGLGAVTAEWRQLAERLARRCTVLLYQRAGYGASSASDLPRTPGNIALELRHLLDRLPHAEKLTLLAHSQGGLYAWAFARAYPELTGRLVLLGPLSPQDFRFRAELTETEFRKSGADKTAGLEWNRKLTRMHLSWLVKQMMSGAPPFYYSSFPAADRAEILASLGAVRTYETALAEYRCGHDLIELAGLLKKEEPVAAPLTLVTHDSQTACQEIQKFGGASEAEARKIEALWQEIMDAYLPCAVRAEKLRAPSSSHCIHLTDPELVCGLV